jgi:hypothetical protein
MFYVLLGSDKYILCVECSVVVVWISAVCEPTNFIVRMSCVANLFNLTLLLLFQELVNWNIAPVKSVFLSSTQHGCMKFWLVVIFCVLCVLCEQNCTSTGIWSYGGDVDNRITILQIPRNMLILSVPWTVTYMFFNPLKTERICFI